MDKLLKEDRFSFVSNENKKFISEFTKEMNLFGYDFGGEIGMDFAGEITWLFILKPVLKTKR
jgi:hypothetical protein